MHITIFVNICQYLSYVISASAEKAFEDADGPFDFCINLAAETKYGQNEEVKVSFEFITNL